MAGKVLVGTASWAEQTLIKSGRFYPPEARTPEERLRFYASQFPVVEVDSSFYALPSFNNSVSWVNRTPDDFIFDVKLFRVFTLHQTPLKSLPTEVRDEVESLANKAGNVYYKDLPDDVRARLWEMFLEGIEPLKSARKLGYLLLQLPPWGTKNRDNVRHVEECLERLNGYGRHRVPQRDVALRAQQGQHCLAGDERADGDRGRASGVRQQHSSRLGGDLD